MKNPARSPHLAATRHGANHGTDSVGNRSSYYHSTTSHGNGQVIYLANGRIAGEILSDGITFQKHIRNRHVLQRPLALALDVDLIERLERESINHVLVINDDTHEFLTANLADFRQYGFRVNRGHGEQLALSLGRFSRDPEKLKPIQLSFL